MKDRAKLHFYVRLIYICLLFTAVSGQKLVAQHSVYQTALSNDKYARAVHSGRMLIDSLMRAENIPGIEVAVSVKGQKVWSQGFGYADLEHKIPVWPFTKMRIGSVSKTLTSAALGKLIEQGKVDIDAPVRNYVPYFPKKRFTITTHQLGGHLAGIRHYRGEEFLSAKHYKTVKAGLHIFMSDTLLFKPGEKFHYSSYGWNLISAVIEGASGQSYLTYMRANVFAPLGMKQTVADYVQPVILHRTEFYTHNKHNQVVNAPYVDNSYKWASGGYLSTVNDLLKFGNAMLKGDYLSRQTIDMLWKSQTTNDGKKTHYGMGWKSGIDAKNYHWVGHSGGAVGGTTQFVLYPRQRVAVAIISNLSDVDYNNIQLIIADKFISIKAQEFEDNSQK